MNNNNLFNNLNENLNNNENNIDNENNNEIRNINNDSDNINENNGENENINNELLSNLNIDDINSDSENKNENNNENDDNSNNSDNNNDSNSDDNDLFSYIIRNRYLHSHENNNDSNNDNYGNMSDSSSEDIDLDEILSRYVNNLDDAGNIEFGDDILSISSNRLINAARSILNRVTNRIEELISLQTSLNERGIEDTPQTREVFTRLVQEYKTTNNEELKRKIEDCLGEKLYNELNKDNEDDYHSDYSDDPFEWLYE